MTRGRKKKLNADWFSHDNDMRHDPDVVALRMKYGHLGYSVWNMLLELLCYSDHTRIEITNKFWNKTAKDFMIPGINQRDKVRRLKNIIYSEPMADLIQIKGDFITCENLVDRIKPIVNKRIEEQKRYHQKTSENIDNSFSATEINNSKEEKTISAVENALNKNKKQKDVSIIVNNNDSSNNNDSDQYNIFFADYKKTLEEEIDIFINQFKILFKEDIKPGPLKVKMIKNAEWIINEYYEANIFFKIMLKRMKDKSTEVKILNPAAWFIDAVFDKKYLAGITKNEENRNINYKDELINEEYPIRKVKK